MNKKCISSCFKQKVNGSHPIYLNIENKNHDFCFSSITDKKETVKCTYNEKDSNENIYTPYINLNESYVLNIIYNIKSWDDILVNLNDKRYLNIITLDRILSISWNVNFNKWHNNISTIIKIYDIYFEMYKKMINKKDILDLYERIKNIDYDKIKSFFYKNKDIDLKVSESKTNNIHIFILNNIIKN